MSEGNQAERRGASRLSCNGCPQGQNVLLVASLAGLELAIREHVTGFRSHTTLLSGVVAIATILLLNLVAGVNTLGPLLIAALFAFAGSIFALRRLFRSRSGGVSFR